MSRIIAVPESQATLIVLLPPSNTAVTISASGLKSRLFKSEAPRVSCNTLQSSLQILSLALKTSNVDLKELTMTGGTKTAAGKNRIVPIHSKIQSIVQKRFEQSKSGYLFEYNGKKLNQSQYREFWADIMDKLQMEHTPHECRHTFRSRLDSAGANKVCIDRLMGHKSKGTGERVYTHKNIEELRLNIELITN